MAARRSPGAGWWTRRSSRPATRRSWCSPARPRCRRSRCCCSAKRRSSCRGSAPAPGAERSTRERIEQLRSELEGLTRALEESRRSKRMLFVTGAELSAEVVRFLTDELHLETHSGEDDTGDFHLADDAGDWCIGDVRGSD